MKQYLGISIIAIMVLLLLSLSNANVSTSKVEMHQTDTASVLIIADTNSCLSLGESNTEYQVNIVTYNQVKSNSLGIETNTKHLNLVHIYMKDLTHTSSNNWVTKTYNDYSTGWGAAMLICPDINTK